MIFDLEPIWARYGPGRSAGYGSGKLQQPSQSGQLLACCCCCCKYLFAVVILICFAQGFGMPRQSPLEEGEHAGDTDDDVMMIDEVDNKGRSSGRRDNMGRGRRSRSRSDSRGKKGKRRRTKSRSRSRDRLDYINDLWRKYYMS